MVMDMGGIDRAAARAVCNVDGYRGEERVCVRLLWRGEERERKSCWRLMIATAMMMIGDTLCQGGGCVLLVSTLHQARDGDMWWEF